jgi:hypothetical protein
VNPPFPAWAYRPTYLPPGLVIDVAEGVPLTEPAFFYLGFASAPRVTDDKYALRLTRITGVAIDTPVSGPRSEVVTSAEASSVLSLRAGERWLMTLTFDNEASGASADLQPVLPLVLKW